MKFKKAIPENVSGNLEHNMYCVTALDCLKKEDNDENEERRKNEQF